MDHQRLTLYSHGSGCGCKIDPGVLDQILSGSTRLVSDPRLLIGNEHRDDAAVLDLGDGTAMISTTDFFMPIVDDPYDFGRIAAANAISDVYAMGGRPNLAIAILGWPVQQLGPELASRVLDGAHAVCQEAGIVLAGGHSIDSVEPFFGLSVNGRIAIANIKENKGAKPGDRIYLSKPLGVGIYATANKLDRIREGDMDKARDTMVSLNRIGAELGEKTWVHAMTDVTGFGLLGHLLEICKASQVSASIRFPDVPVLDKDALNFYMLMQCVPAATARNWASASSEVNALPKEIWQILSDPQTSGGLLVVTDPESGQMMEDLASSQHQLLCLIGEIEDDKSPRVSVIY